MKKYLIITSVLVAFSFIANAQGYVFNKDLSVGSTGSDVSALQTWLIQNGYHIPSIESSAVAKGRFGQETKAAVMKYQKDVKVKTTGFVGPLTRGKLNGNTSVSNTAPGNTAATSATITTPGVPGIMAATQGPLSSSVLHVGQSQAPIINVRVQAQYSDIDVAGLVVDLGTDTAAYNKVFSKIYVYDGSTLLFSTPLNSTSVVEVSGQYVVGTAGYNDIVPKGTYRDIVVKADLYPSIDSKYINESPWYVSVDQGSVSGVDGAGVILYSPSDNGLIVQGLTINASLVDNAQANISLDQSSPLVKAQPVTDTTNNQFLGLPVLVFGVNAQNDTVHLHDLKVNVTTTGPGTVGAAYLMQGSTPIASASVSNGVADFANITDGTAGATIPVNTTLPYTVTVDVTGVTAATTITASTSATGNNAPIIYSSNDSSVVITGAALGNAQTVSKVGPLFTLVSSVMNAPTVTTDNSGNASSTYVATFNVQVQAVGSDVALGLPGSTSPAFASTTFKIFKDQVDNGTVQAGAGTVSFAQPTGTTISGTTITVSRNQTVTIPVTVSFKVVKTASTYAAQLDSINWSASGANGPTNFMSGQPSWRTSSL